MTPKLPVSFFPILNSALPKACEIWVVWSAASGTAILIRLLGLRITYSAPRTITARPASPVSTTSPGLRLSPRSAGATTPPVSTLTSPLRSVTSQFAGAA